MSSARMYRVASVLLVLFAAAHSFGFRQVDPTWNADTTIAAMKTTFQVQGQTRSYWDFRSECAARALRCRTFVWLSASRPDVERRYHDRRNEDDLSSAGTDAVVLGFPI